jgi:1-deoxy-D-xylulose-5-phosphate synthase
MNIQKIKKADKFALNLIAKDIRRFLIKSISKTGGHIGANLSTIELTIAIHKVFNSPKDKIIFDTGHQGYTHKIITGRADKFNTLNQNGGLSRFVSRKESVHDIIDASHAGTALSFACGFAHNQNNKKKFYTIAIVGDGTMVEGMNFEALNFSSVNAKNLIIILNDNEMAIDKSVGGFKSLTTGRYWKKKTRNFFKGLNLDYYAIEDGHNITKIVNVLNRVKKKEKTTVIHLKTQKGKGLEFAKKHKYKMHFSMPFDPLTGEGSSPTILGKTMGVVAAKKVNEILSKNKSAIAITPATPYASYLDEIEKKNLNRVIDVGMAEQHAVGFAAGLSLRGLKPILFFQSTFLQRAYDQLLHDLSFMNSDVLIISARSGFAGFDSPTHHGVFDISYLNSIPYLKIFYPNTEVKLTSIIEKIMSKNNKGPSIILLPYETIDNKVAFDNKVLISKKNSHFNLIIFCLLNTLKVADEIRKSKELKTFINVKIYCLDKIKPLNSREITKVITNNKKSKFISIEENVLNGGLGSIIKSQFYDHKLDLINFGIKNKFIESGDKESCLEKADINAKKIILFLNKKYGKKTSK